jgi:SAM-dependent methyltransferase
MDADLLASTGARVICSDLSAAAVRRARCRAERFGLSIVPIVADVERLPFKDRSVDLVYVQDGLHHLEDPYVALAEMARVARRAVSLTEPADGLVPRLAVRLGLGLEHEPAGNRVARLDRGRVAEALRSHGLAVTRARRYLIYYRHRPGQIMELLSHPMLMALVRTALSVLNATLGRHHGNRLTVQAVRAATEAPPDGSPTPAP